MIPATAAAVAAPEHTAAAHVPLAVNDAPVCNPLRLLMLKAGSDSHRRRLQQDLHITTSVYTASGRNVPNVLNAYRDIFECVPALPL